MTVQEKFYTADDLWALSHRDDDSDIDMRYELDEGELIEMSPTGDTHGEFVVWLTYLFFGYVSTHDLGVLSGAETGYVLYTDPKTGRDTVRAPDIGFIAKARLTPRTGKFYRLAPDLAIEVVSPTDTARQIRRKVGQFMQAGTRMMLVFYPEEKIIDVYKAGGEVRVLTVDDTLDGGDALPGFAVPVREVFARLRE